MVELGKGLVFSGGVAVNYIIDSAGESLERGAEGDGSVIGVAGKDDVGKELFRDVGAAVFAKGELVV